MHSPKPWKADDSVPIALHWGDADTTLVETKDRHVAFVYEPEDAKRIVACVNFLQGIPTEVLNLLRSHPEWHQCVLDELLENIQQFKRDQAG